MLKFKTVVKIACDSSMFNTIKDIRKQIWQGKSLPKSRGHICLACWYLCALEIELFFFVTQCRVYIRHHNIICLFSSPQLLNIGWGMQFGPRNSPKISTNCRGRLFQIGISRRVQCCFLYLRMLDDSTSTNLITMRRMEVIRWKSHWAS